MSTGPTAGPESTKQAIANAAAELFAERDYNSVTMREIARRAGCSHTAIYIYFKDKAALLHHLALEPMQQFKERLQYIAAHESTPPVARLKWMSREFIRFCLLNRAQYQLFLLAEPARVDDENAALEIQRLRNEWFEILKRAVAACVPDLPDGDREATAAEAEAEAEATTADERRLAHARIYFFMLHGIIASYIYGPESADAVMARLAPTFDLAFATLLAGFRQNAAPEVPR